MDIKGIEQYVLETTKKQLAHEYKHADRVRNWALKIAKAEGYQKLELVEIAALLHDIGYPFTPKRSKHADTGADVAGVYLKINNICSDEDISEVVNAIKFHSSNRLGEGQLLDIIRDADALDLMGAVGIMRAFGDGETPLTEYDPENIKGQLWECTAKDIDKRFDQNLGLPAFAVDHLNFQISCFDNLKSETAKKAAKPMIEFIKQFILELEKEIKQL